ncbi:MAG: hypothetical protein EBX50_14445 [Chitinophagia bacterium]|nr:hypothetical protein [Chitinophagia bacterium]
MLPNSNEEHRKSTSQFEIEEIRALNRYVKEHTVGPLYNSELRVINSLPAKSRITKMFAKVSPLTEELTLWRGQDDSEINTSHENRWISTSTTRAISTGFMGKTAKSSLFLIHVQPGIRVLDAHTILKKAGKNLSNSIRSENEWIVEAGGEYYKDPRKSEKGFAKRKDGVLETWYFPKDYGSAAAAPVSVATTRALTGRDILDRIESDGLNINLSETRNSLRAAYVNDLYETITNAELDSVLSSLSSSKGGKRTRKTRKHRSHTQKLDRTTTPRN